jgi:DNA helicase MCM9
MADLIVSTDPRSVSPLHYRRSLQEFILKCLFRQLEDLVFGPTSAKDHHSFLVKSHDLIDYDPTLGFIVIYHPKLILPLFDQALVEAQNSLIRYHTPVSTTSKGGSVKLNCHVRVVSLPPTESICKPTISDIRADETEALVQISGTIVRTGGVRMLEKSKQFECQNPKCRFRFTVAADPEQDNVLVQPRTCPSQVREGLPAIVNDGSDSAAASSGNKKCSSTSIREVEGSRVCVDYQEIKVQDSFERVPLGAIPRSIIVILEGDLVDKFNAGDDVVIVGVILRQWRPVFKGGRCSVDTAIRANSVVSLNATDKIYQIPRDAQSRFESFWETFRNSGDCDVDGHALLTGRDIIVRSICPQLYGLFYVKLALLLTLVGGCDTQADRGVRRRSQSHLLLVGDPGCGKSQLMRFAASVVPRSVLTTGIGTSGAGLTCTAVKDGGEWALEAGALVLANGK